MVNNYYESYETSDRMVTRVQYIYWGVIEIVTAITCANIPALPGFYRHITRNKSRVRSAQHKRFRIFPASGSGGSYESDDKNIGKKSSSFLNRFGCKLPSFTSVFHNDNLDKHYHHHYHHHHHHDHYNYQNSLDERSRNSPRGNYPILPRPGGMMVGTGVKQNSATTFAVNEV